MSTLELKLDTKRQPMQLMTFSISLDPENGDLVVDGNWIDPILFRKTAEEVMPDHPNTPQYIEVLYYGPELFQHIQTRVLEVAQSV